MAPDVHAPKNCSIREFRYADLPSVSQIATASAEASQWSPESYSELAADARGLLLVAECGPGVSGFLAARLAADESEILNVAVRADMRRSGIASALLKAALKRLRHEGGTAVFLEVRESNAAAIALYKKFGFSAETRRKGYYRDPAEDALCMMKKLTGDRS